MWIMDPDEKSNATTQRTEELTTSEDDVQHPTSRWADFRNRVFKRRYLLPTALVIWTVFTGFFFAFADSYNASGQLIHCNADGTIHVAYLDSYHPSRERWNQMWVTSSWFSITLSFGRLTFAEAKIIDICWDLFVGRGGQLILITSTYSLMRRYMELLLRNGSSFFDAFCGLAFSPCSFASTTIMIRRIQSRLGPSVLLRAAGIIVLSMYIGLFPTLLSAMTSYQAKAQPYTLGPDGYFPSSTLEQLEGFIIVTGNVFGVNDYFPVPTNSSLLLEVSRYYDTSMKAIKYGIFNPDRNMTYDHATGIYSNIYTCSPAALCNITVSQDSLRKILSVTDVRSWETSIRLTGQLHEVAELVSVQESWHTLYHLNNSYNQTAMMESTVCQPDEHYRWGFASLFLFAFCILTEVILLVALAMDVDVRRRYPEGVESRYTLLGDILAIATALHRLADQEKEECSNANIIDLTKRHPVLLLDENDELELTTRPDAVRRRR